MSLELPLENHIFGMPQMNLPMIPATDPNFRTKHIGKTGIMDKHKRVQRFENSTNVEGSF